MFAIGHLMGTVSISRPHSDRANAAADISAGALPAPRAGNVRMIRRDENWTRKISLYA